MDEKRRHYTESGLLRSTVDATNLAMTVIGVFKSEEQAKKAVSELRKSDFVEEEINIISKKQEHEDNRESYYDDDVTDGAFTGTTLGGIGGLIIGAGALAIPGIGPIIAAGPIAAALSGALAGGIAGGLIDWGIPSQASKRYESSVAHGDILAIIRTNQTKINEAAEILRSNGAQDVETHSIK